MKNEAAFWSGFVRPLLHCPAEYREAWKIPAEIRKGLPDVWFGNLAKAGWIELKYVREWPVRLTTPITVEVTAEQLGHLRACARIRHPAWCLIGVERSWFLLHPDALEPMMKLSRAELGERSTAWGMRKTDDLVLLDALQRF